MSLAIYPLAGLRTDFSPDHTVAEIAIGMDRVMDIK